MGIRDALHTLELSYREGGQGSRPKKKPKRPERVFVGKSVSVCGIAVVANELVQPGKIAVVTHNQKIPVARMKSRLGRVASQEQLNDMVKNFNRKDPPWMR